MQSLTEGKVSSLLIRFSGPFLLAGIVQMGHGLINVFLLSWLASPASVAGAFNGGLLVFTLTSVFMGLGTGGMILLGQFVGGKQDKNAAKAVGNTILVQFAVAVTCALFILALGRISIRILNVPYYLLDDGLSAAGEAWRFMRVVAFGMVFQTGYNIINSMLRALGDSKRPMIFIAISCVLNIGFDLIFIGVLHMGAAGAALGTVIAQVCGFTIALLYLLKKKFPFAFGFRDIRPDKDILKKTFKLGIPISMQMLLNMLSFTVIARIINGMGTAEAAANSLINTVFNFVIVVPSALGSALSSISAQNFGAGKSDRALKSTKLAIMFSLCIAVPAVLVANIFPTAIVSLLSPEADVVRVAAQFLVPFSWDFVLFSFVFCINNFYNGCGITTFVAAHELVAAFLVRVPVTWLLSTLPEATLFHVAIGTPAASVASLAMLLIYYRVKLSRGKLAKLQMDSASI